MCVLPISGSGSYRRSSSKAVSISSRERRAGASRGSAGFSAISSRAFSYGGGKKFSPRRVPGPVSGSGEKTLSNAVSTSSRGDPGAFCSGASRSARRSKSSLAAGGEGGVVGMSLFMTMMDSPHFRQRMRAPLPLIRDSSSLKRARHAWHSMIILLPPRPFPASSQTDYNGFAGTSQPGSSFLSPPCSEGAQEDAHLVEDIDHDGDEELGDDIRGGEDRPQEKHPDHRHLPPAAQKARGEDSRPPRAKQDQRDLEHHPEEEKDPQNQREGIPHRRHRNDGRSPEGEEEGEDRRDRDEVSERHPGQQGRRRPEGEEEEELSFFPVESGADETPRLVEDHGARQEKSSPQGQLEVGEERLGEFGEDEPGTSGEPIGEGSEKRPVDPFRAGVAQDGSHPHRGQGADQARPQLFEVLGERQADLGVRFRFRVHLAQRLVYGLTHQYAAGISRDRRPFRARARRPPEIHSLRSRHSRAAASAPASLPPLTVPRRVRLGRAHRRARRIDPLGARPLRQRISGCRGVP